MSDFRARNKHEKQFEAAVIAAFADVPTTDGKVDDHGLEKLRKSLKTRLVAPVQATIDDAVDQVCEDYKIDETPKEVKGKIGVDADDYANSLANEIVANTQTAAVQSADFPDIVAKLFSSARAGVIGVTEVTALHSAIIKALALASMIDVQLIWHTSGDDNVCEDCEAKDGMLTEVVGEPPEHPNCNCWIE